MKYCQISPRAQSLTKGGSTRRVDPSGSSRNKILFTGRSILCFLQEDFSFNRNFSFGKKVFLWGLYTPLRGVETLFLVLVLDLPYTLYPISNALYRNTDPLNLAIKP